MSNYSKIKKDWIKPLAIFLGVFLIFSWTYGSYVLIGLLVLLFFYLIYDEISRLSLLKEHTFTGKIINYKYDLEGEGNDNTILEVKIIDAGIEEKIVHVRASYILSPPVIGAHLKVYVKNDIAEIVVEHEGFIVFLKIISALFFIVFFGFIYWYSNSK